MATLVYNYQSINEAVTISGTDNIYVTQFGEIINTGPGFPNTGEAIFVSAGATTNDITIDGMVFGSRTGILSFAETEIDVRVNGRLSSGSTGASLERYNFADVTVSVGGVITGDTALRLIGTSAGVVDGSATVTNAGSIIGNTAFQILGLRTTINNSGTISGQFFLQGADADFSFININNTGVITSTGSFTFEMFRTAINISNLGVWQGFGFNFTDNVDSLFNAGQFDSDVNLLGGADVVTNTGDIFGAVSLGAGDDVLDSRDGRIFGAISGGDGADTITGGVNNDTIDGGAGADVMDGGGGVNTLVYSQSLSRVVVNLETGLGKGGNASGDEFTNFQNIVGSLFSDVLIGDDSANTITGGFGNDRFIGGGGNDVLIGNSALVVPGFPEFETPGNDRFSGGDGNDRIVTGGGVDVAFGDAGNDRFQMGANLTAADQINGGTGIDTLFLNGAYNLTLGSLTVRAVEVFDLSAGFNYALTTAQATVAAGQTLTVDATDLAAPNRLQFNGAAETDGAFILLGGGGADVLTGGAGADQINGGGFSDVMQGGNGADTFVFGAVSESTGTRYDTLVGFNFAAGGDRFDLVGVVTAIDTAVTTGALNSGGTFNANLAAALPAAQLALNNAVVFTPNVGTLAGTTFLVVDANGVAGYQANADFVFLLTSPVNLASLDTADFI